MIASLILSLAFATQVPAPAVPSATPGWHWTRKLDGSVGYLWGHKDHLGRVVPDAQPATPATPTAPAAKPAIVGGPTSTPIPNYGVSRDRFPPTTGKAWYGGNASHPVAASGPTATRDEGPAVHVTVIGSEAERESVLGDLQRNAEWSALEQAMGDSLAIQDYAPTDAMVAAVKLPDGGRPDIVIQDRTGKVKYRAHSYKGATELVGEIRRADPDYDARRDPGGGLSSWFGSFDLQNDENLLVIVAACGLGYFLWKQTKKS